MIRKQEENLKTCNVCKATLPKKEFSKNGAGYLIGTCKKCNNERSKETNRRKAAERKMYSPI